MTRLVQILRERPVLMVWDNFEAAAGSASADASPLLSEPDRAILKDLLKRLRRGRSKVLITSRSSEPWLPPTEAFGLALPGLRGEEAWVYCNEVVRALGLQIERKAPDVRDLLAELDGHPLVLRLVLMHLHDEPARTLLQRFKRELAAVSGDESMRRILAALGLLNQKIPQSLAPALQLLGLHQRHVQLDLVASMLEPAEGDAQHAALTECLAMLERGGLLQPVQMRAYAVHPALHAFMAKAYPASEGSIGRFIAVMAGYAVHITPMELHEQRPHWVLHAANFRHALTLASARANADHARGLTRALEESAFNSGDFAAV